MIGDTIATGTTLSGVIEWVLNAREKGSDPLNIAIFSIAGSSACLRKLKRFNSNSTVNISLYIANVDLILDANGTDLKIDGAQMTPQTPLCLICIFFMIWFYIIYHIISHI